MSCSTLLPLAGGATGAAAGSAIAGPGGAAVGAAGGILAGELVNEDVIPNAPSIPTDGIPGTVNSLSSFLDTIGWWFLIIFVIIPLVSRKFRLGTTDWLFRFINSASKKQVLSMEERLDKLEKSNSLQ